MYHWFGLSVTMYLDAEQVRTKLLNQHTRPFWEVWLWDPEAVLYGGWCPLQDAEGHQRMYDRAEALANLALARATHGSGAVLKLMAWTVAEDNDG
jgi:hypothetical protein